MKHYIVTFVYCQSHERYPIDAEDIEDALKQAQKRREIYYGQKAEITCIKLRQKTDDLRGKEGLFSRGRRGDPAG